MEARSPDSGWASARDTGCALLCYLALATALTWPLVLSPQSALWGDYGDTRGWASAVWARINGLAHQPVNPLLAAPFGTPRGVPVPQPIADWSVALLARIAGEIAAINLFTLVALAVTAAATFFVVYRLSGSRVAAFFAGVVFGFCPASVMQSAGGHGGASLNAFIALFLLALFQNRSRRSAGSAFAVALSFACVVFTSIYAGYFAVYVAIFFVAYDALTAPRLLDRPMLRSYAWCAGMALLILLPVELPMIQEQLTTSRDAIAQRGRVHGFHELATYSSRIWDYFLPSIDHPLFGHLVEPFVRSHLHGSNVFEQTLYLGAVPLGLVACGVVMAIRGGFEPARSRYFAFFILAALWMCIVSMPPKVGDVAPTPSYFAYFIAPMFRVYARAGVLVNLFVACAAAIVLAEWGERMRRSRFYGVSFTVILLAAFEYWSVPPGYARPLATPPVYAWLAEQPADVLVAEYPMVRFDEAAFYSYPFWQRVHGKRLVNGAAQDNPQAWRFFEQVQELGDPATYSRLRSVGVTYVIVHAAMYRDGPIPSPIKRYYPPERAALAFNGGVPPSVPRGFLPYRTFGDDMVYVLQP